MGIAIIEVCMVIALIYGVLNHFNNKPRVLTKEEKENEKLLGAIYGWKAGEDIWK